MKKSSIFYCSVPVPERKEPKVKIRGTLYSENELKTWFEKSDFIFMPRPFENGALLYFQAKLDSGHQGINHNQRIRESSRDMKHQFKRIKFEL